MHIGGRPALRWLVAADAAAALAIGLFAFLQRPAGNPLLWVPIALLVLAMPLRRITPIPTLSVVLAVGASAALVGVPGDVVVIAVAFALYPVALEAARTAAWAALGAAIAAVLIPGMLSLWGAALPVVPAAPGQESFASSPLVATVYSIVLIAGSWIMGRVLRARRAYAEELARLREQQAVTEERLRIARDVHDAVGHSLSVITMKAAVTEHLTSTNSPETSAALQEIEHIGRESLDEIRNVLSALRNSGDSGRHVDVEDLIATAESAGLTLEYDHPADLSTLPHGVQTSVYRIVQEALTNAIRFATPPWCRLVVRYNSTALTISVTNRHQQQSGRSYGNGLQGMQERIALHGGHLTAGPTPDGRFVVHGTIPLSQAGSRDT